MKKIYLWAMTVAMIFAFPFFAFAGGGSDNCVVFEEPDPGLVGTFQGTIHWTDGRASGSYDVKYTLKRVGAEWVLEASWDTRCTGRVKGPQQFKVYKDRLVSPDGDITFSLKGGKVNCRFHGESITMKKA